MSRSALIYTAIAAIAIAGVAFIALRDPATQAPAAAGNSAGAPLPDMAGLAALREGDMKKLAIHSAPKAAGAAAYDTAEGAKATLADHAGRYVLVNFWATWCAPCRKEMPALAALQSEFGGEDFEVLTIATGRNQPAAIAKFFREIGVENLPAHRDPSQALAREMGVLGLPVSVILAPDGREIARMTGDADWASESGRAIVKALIAGPGS